MGVCVCRPLIMGALGGPHSGSAIHLDEEMGLGTLSVHLSLPDGQDGPFYGECFFQTKGIQGLWMGKIYGHCPQASRALHHL